MKDQLSFVLKEAMKMSDDDRRVFVTSWYRSLSPAQQQMVQTEIRQMVGKIYEAFEPVINELKQQATVIVKAFSTMRIGDAQYNLHLRQIELEQELGRQWNVLENTYQY